jgi:hypothetical protein
MQHTLIFYKHLHLLNVDADIIPPWTMHTQGCALAQNDMISIT